MTKKIFGKKHPPLTSRPTFPDPVPEKEAKIPSMAKDLLKGSEPPPVKPPARALLEKLAAKLRVPVKSSYEPNKDRNDRDIEYDIESAIANLQAKAKELDNIYHAFDTLARLNPMMMIPPFGRW